MAKQNVNPVPPKTKRDYIADRGRDRAPAVHPQRTGTENVPAHVPDAQTASRKAPAQPKSKDWTPGELNQGYRRVK